MRRSALLLGVAVVAVAVTLVAVLGRGGSPSYEPVPLSGPLAAEIDRPSGPLVRPVAAEVGEPAPTSAEAVDRFVTAEIEARFAASYDLLSNADRVEHGNAEGWRQAHHELPRLTGLEALDAAGGDVVVTEVSLEPRLDRTLGAVPARAKISWLTVPEDGGWRVAYSKSAIEARYPDDSGAGAVVRAWAEAARRCEDTSPLEVASGLVGVRGYAPQLCEATGSVDLGTVSRLDALDDPTVALSAFGPDAGAFVRVVDLRGPVAMRVLAAPEGDRWLVVGLAAP